LHIVLRLGVSALTLPTGDTGATGTPDATSTVGGTWADMARRYESAGFDTLWAPDHIGMPDPFAALVAAAASTDRIRVGTYVLNVEFWHPVLLARVAATTHLVTGGRLVLGLGAGHNKAEFDQAGLRYPPPRERIDRLAATVTAVRRLMAGETVDDDRLGLAGAATGLPPARPPILVGGNGDRVLGLAGREADLVGIVGFTAGTGAVHTNLSHWGWDGLADRLARARSARGQRRDRLAADVLVQRAAITDDPRAALADFLDAGLREEQIDSPFLLVGTEDELLAKLARLEGAGVDGVTVFAREADGLAPVITRYRAMSPLT
jgi:probable F420-dependent oxidoreductase